MSMTFNVPSIACRGSLAQRSRERVNELLHLSMVKVAALLDAANRNKKEGDIQVSQIAIHPNGAVTMLMEDGNIAPYSENKICGFNFSPLIAAELSGGITGERTYACPECGNVTEITLS